MEETVIFLLGTILSCFICSVLLFQFMKENYYKKYQSKLLYRLLPLGTSAIMVIINCLKNPLMNMLAWVILFGIIVIVLYDTVPKAYLKKILEIIILIFILKLCEGIGYFMMEFVIEIISLHFSVLMIGELLQILFSKLLVLSLYAIVVRIWKGKKQKLTRLQYILYGIIIFYTIFNMTLVIIAVAGGDELNTGQRSLLLIHMCGIIFLDIFFLYFTKFSEEQEQLKFELNLLEQQADVQYGYYVSQEEIYKQSLSILHDVNKHLTMMEEIYQVEKAEEAKRYTKEIQQLLQPLLPQNYTNNTILNILLSEKKRSAMLNQISFTMEIYDVNLEFIKPIDITTIFGNLLDNAIEACKKVTQERDINLKVDSYNSFIVIQLINSVSDDAKWINGRPISNKGKNYGIGLNNVENIIKKYNGNMILEKSDGIFKCNIMMNE